MNSTSDNKINKETLNSLNEELALEVAKNLKNDNYTSPFDGLKHFNLLRITAIKSYELTSDFINILDQ